MQITFDQQELLDALNEVRLAISVVNRGGVIFNPAATSLVDALIIDAEGGAA